MNKNRILSFYDIVLLLPVKQQYNLHGCAYIILFIPVASIFLEAVLCDGVYLTQ